MDNIEKPSPDKIVKISALTLYEILQHLVEVEGYTKVVRSDVRHILSALRYQFDNVDIVIDEETGEVEKIEQKQYDRRHHPARREEDKTGTFDRMLKYFVDRVLPQLITWAFIGWITYQFAINNRLIVLEK